jgi:hypothetical protein
MQDIAPQEIAPPAGQDQNGGAPPPLIPNHNADQEPPFIAPGFDDLEELFHNILNDPVNQNEDIIVLD